MSHITVLLNEAVAALALKPDGVYIDATFGRGGHSRLILSQLSKMGRLIVFDQDESAIQTAEREWGEDLRVTIIHANFSELEIHLKRLNLWGKVDGILFDLGVSSPQLDERERGFSFLKAGPLDMRMDQGCGLTLRQKLLTVDLAELTRVLRCYGEERFAARIARAILKARSAISNTLELAEVVKDAVPKSSYESHKHPATRTFQALRIWVNEELLVLERVLGFFPELLAVSGRAVFISFHSLEDRLIKERIKLLTTPKAHPRGLPIMYTDEHSPPMQICIKMQKPSEAEIKTNPRARSSVLRAAVRIK